MNDDIELFCWEVNGFIAYGWMICEVDMKQLREWWAKLILNFIDITLFKYVF